MKMLVSVEVGVLVALLVAACNTVHGVCPSPRHGRPAFFLHMHKGGFHQTQPCLSSDLYPAGMGTMFCHLARRNRERMNDFQKAHNCNLQGDGPHVPNPILPGLGLGNAGWDCEARARYAKTTGLTFVSREMPLFAVADLEAAARCRDHLMPIVGLRPPLIRIASNVRVHGLKVPQILDWLQSDHPQPTGRDVFLGSRWVNNYYTRMLNGPLVYQLPLGGVTREHLEHAKQVLQNLFEVILTSDTIDTDVDMARAALGWHGRKPIRREPTTDSTNVTLSLLVAEPSLAQLLHEHNRLDHELYNFALGLKRQSCSTVPR